MRRLWSVAAVAAALGLWILGAHGETAPSGKTGSKKTATTHKKATTHRTGTRRTATHRTGTGRTGATVERKSGASASHSARSSARRGKKYAHRATWRNRQLTPTPDRYKQIQDALAAKGYLAPDQANGQWSDASSAALKKFQADQNIDPSGKIDSLSLIALGLGPKHDTATVQKAEPVQKSEPVSAPSKP